jgi:hypothetical protein
LRIHTLITSSIGHDFYMRIQAGATSGALGELARTIQQEVECLEEATRLSSIVTGLQVGAPSFSSLKMMPRRSLGDTKPLDDGLSDTRPIWSIPSSYFAASSTCS